MTKRGFSPISIEEYLDLHMASNPSLDRSEVEAGLREMIRYHQEGGRCHCGNEIWVIGSAAAHWPGCFSHITGESFPDEDFEIDF